MLLDKISYRFLVTTKLFTRLRVLIKAHLHWQSLLAKLLGTVTSDSHKSDRMIPILCCTAQGSQGKYNSDCRVSLLLALSP